MSAVKEAFKVVIQFAGFPRTFNRLESPPVIEVINAAPSSYFRQTIGPEEITINANEIVVDADDLKTYGVPKKGHRVSDDIHGNQSISTVVPMIIMGEVVGYRIRFK